eukprot:TRINITY_DN2496_c0_g2_i1.p1 TRINITY_DN2496_c0_g2~~TRINITY_DN2496_c0_g2_i1.p1  ORF type:complete len:191 (+),score=9.07 TRINITY_DN2496_c0_g2_i1:38-574(+)
MSARVVCISCQTPATQADKFCSQCGEILPSSMLDVTDAVKASDDNETRGQQKWKGFETNYQRTKGISTDESIKEIEEFARTGVRPEAAPGTQPWSGSSTDGKAGGSTTSSSVSSKFTGGGKFGGGSSAGTSSTTTTPSLVGTVKFPKASGPGEEAFKKYDEGDKWKNYQKPAYSGKKW